MGRNEWELVRLHKVFKVGMPSVHAVLSLQGLGASQHLKTSSNVRCKGHLHA